MKGMRLSKRFFELFPENYPARKIRQRRNPARSDLFATTTRSCSLAQNFQFRPLPRAVFEHDNT